VSEPKSLQSRSAYFCMGASSLSFLNSALCARAASIKWPALYLDSQHVPLRKYYGNTDSSCISRRLVKRRPGSTTV
jgi:hypothetical protein